MNAIKLISITVLSIILIDCLEYDCNSMIACAMNDECCHCYTEVSYSSLLKFNK